MATTTLMCWFISEKRFILEEAFLLKQDKVEQQRITTNPHQLQLSIYIYIYIYTDGVC